MLRTILTSHVQANINIKQSLSKMCFYPLNLMTKNILIFGWVIITNNFNQRVSIPFLLRSSLPHLLVEFCKGINQILNWPHINNYYGTIVNQLASSNLINKKYLHVIFYYFLSPTWHWQGSNKKVKTKSTLF